MTNIDVKMLLLILYVNQDCKGDQQKIHTYAEVLLWWKNCAGSQLDVATYNYLVYKYWDVEGKNWAKETAAACMSNNGWVYGKSFVEWVKAAMKRSKNNLKGCIEVNFMYSKG